MDSGRGCPAQIPDRGQYVPSSHRREVEEVGPSHKGPRSGSEHIDETGTGRAEGEEISETLSLSIFTIEADSKPLLAFAAKKHQEAVAAFCADERALTKLRSVRSGGVPLCNIRFCAFGWQLQRREPVTTIGRSSDHPWKLAQRSFWSTWTKHRPAPPPRSNACRRRRQRSCCSARSWDSADSRWGRWWRAPSPICSGYDGRR
jgi:hypothetical protein